MTAYYLKMHPFIRDKATITRMDGATVYTVKTAFSLLGRTLAIVDTNKQIVAKIRQTISPITPRFRIAVNEQTPFYLQRRFSLLPDYKITGRSLIVTGDYSKHFVSYTNGKQIYEIKKDCEMEAEAYSITVVSDADALEGIGIALAIIMAKQALRRSAN